MHYIDLSGTFVDAIEKVKTEGGRLYQGKTSESSHTVVIGDKCYTYWLPDSRRRQEIKSLCEYFHLDSEGQTGGRLARWFVQHIIEIPYQGTYWDRKYRAIAKEGAHWHYTFVNTDKYIYGVEFDLKSAYFNSLFALGSLLYQPNLGVMKDNGALERLKSVTPFLPKWFRLQVLGVLASYKMTFFSRPKNYKEGDDLQSTIQYKIQYGAAFNAAHRAIIRNYKIMQKVHEIAGKYIERMHTDSFFLNLECPEKVENLVFEYLAEKKAVIDIKKAGLAYFFDLNTGYIGNQFIGCPQEVILKMREARVKMVKEGGCASILLKYEKYPEYIEKVQEIANTNSSSVSTNKNIQLCLNLNVVEPVTIGHIN